jgi:hypothetical protein
MNRYVLFLLILVQGSIHASAKDWQFGALQQLGISIADGRVSAFPQLINGVRYKNCFVGLGLAYEPGPRYYYSLQPPLIPLFLDGRAYFGRKLRYFALSDVGLNFIGFDEALRGNEWHYYRRQTGYYLNVGLGIKSKLAGSVFYSFDLNYNFSSSRYQLHQFNSQHQEWNTEQFIFKQQRILLRFGIELND